MYLLMANSGLTPSTMQWGHFGKARFLMWLLLSVAVSKRRRLASRTILKHRYILQKQRGAQEERGTSTLCMETKRDGVGLGMFPLERRGSDSTARVSRLRRETPGQRGHRDGSPLKSPVARYNQLRAKSDRNNTER